jgi:hypothetical protein
MNMRDASTLVLALRIVNAWLAQQARGSIVSILTNVYLIHAPMVGYAAIERLIVRLHLCARQSTRCGEHHGLMDWMRSIVLAQAPTTAMNANSSANVPLV